MGRLIQKPLCNHHRPYSERMHVKAQRRRLQRCIKQRDNYLWCWSLAERALL